MQKLKTIVSLLSMFVAVQLSYAQDDLNMVNQNSYEGIQVYNKFRLGLDYGYASNTGSIPEGLDSETAQYLNDLKRGYFIGGSFSMKMSQTTSIGFKVSSSRSSADMDIQVYDDNYNLITGKVRDNLQNTLYAITYSSQYTGAFGTATFGSLVGYMTHLDYGSLFGVAVEQKGGALALGVEGAYDIKITDHLAFGVQLAYILSNMTQYESTVGGQTEIVNLDRTEQISLGRWEIGGGLRFSF